MAGFGESLWRLYEASPPALLALLVVTVSVGGNYLKNELHTLQDTQAKVVNRVDQQEIMIDHNAERLDRIHEAKQRNDRRIEELLQQAAAAQGFGQRKPENHDAEADTASHSRPDGGADPSDPDDRGDL